MTTDEKPRDPTVKDTMKREESRGKRRRPIDPEERRKKSILAENALRAIQARDERAFSDALRRAGIRDGSPDWERAWKFYRSACGKS